MLDNSEDEVAATEARRAQDEAGGVRRHPNMIFTNRLKAMDDRFGNIDTHIYKVSNEVENLTDVVSGMTEQYDQFYGEFNTLMMEQQRFHTWETDHLPQLLAYHHIDHTRYDATRPHDFSTTPTAPTDLFGMFELPVLDILLPTTSGTTWTRSDSSCVFRPRNNL
ncbi:hypothetical protein Tco_0203985 [Tanacetum coccineum]